MQLGQGFKCPGIPLVQLQYLLVHLDGVEVVVNGLVDVSEADVGIDIGMFAVFAALLPVLLLLDLDGNLVMLDGILVLLQVVVGRSQVEVALWTVVVNFKRLVVVLD